MKSYWRSGPGIQKNRPEAPKSLQMVTAAMKLKDAYSLEGKLWPTFLSILKSRDITSPTKVRLVKAMVFPVVLYGCESWTVKKAERRRIDFFELWCWKKLLSVPWTSRRSNQSILKEISPGISLEGMIWKRLWCWEGLGAGGEGEDREWDGWMASLTRWMWVWVNSRRWWWTGRPGVLRFMGSQRVGHDWATELNWTEYICVLVSQSCPTLYDLMDCSLSDSSVHGIFQARILNGLPFPSPICKSQVPAWVIL